MISRNTISQVNADIEKTAWVLINFLSNALRYSPEKARVLIQAIESNSAVGFSVRDVESTIGEGNRFYFRLPVV